MLGDVLRALRSGPTFPFQGAGRNASGRVPSCRVYHNATQTSNNAGASTAMTFNSERFDTDNMHDITTNPTRITIRTPGIYQTGGSLLYPIDATGNYRALRIRVNSATDIALSQHVPVAAAVGAALNVGTLWQMAAGDWFELVTVHNAAGNLTIPLSTGFECEFWATLVGNV